MTERILVVGPSWVGDMVMSQVLYKLLRRRWQDCEIDVLAPELGEDGVRQAPHLRAPSPDKAVAVAEDREQAPAGRQLAAQVPEQPVHGVREERLDLERLERANASLGVVTAIVGMRQLRLLLRGEGGLYLPRTSGASAARVS